MQQLSAVTATFEAAKRTDGEAELDLRRELAVLQAQRAEVQARCERQEAELVGLRNTNARLKEGAQVGFRARFSSVQYASRYAPPRPLASAARDCSAYNPTAPLTLKLPLSSYVNITLRRR